MVSSETIDRTAQSEAILLYWFAGMDDSSSLDRTIEPMRTCFSRWYGKEPAIDREIQALFEADLLAIASSSQDWDREMDAWARAPLGLLALVILLDQFPRNIYRGTPAMYAHDALALSAATVAIREYRTREMPLVQRMFLYVPLMHVENSTVQRHMTRHFEQLALLARERSRANVQFYEFALTYARRHAEVIDEFGRFPHRNPILGRLSTPKEEEYLRGPDPGF